MREATGTGRQRRRAGLALLACFGVGACEVPRALNPAEIYREVSGANDAMRPTPPGLDRPFPSLGSVPPRPDRPSPEAREAISAALAADRSRSREPFALREAPGEGAPLAPAGMAAGPPPRPALAAAPRVPWTEAAPPPSARSGGVPPPATSPATPAAAPSARPPTPRPAVPAAALPEVPDAAPAPPPDLLGAPPPPPSLDLLAPPPPARR